jgi:uncharacterized protein (DUF1330 family)
MAAYFLARVKVVNEEEYRKYMDRNPESITKYGGKFFFRNGPREYIEGQDENERIVLLEFPTIEQAKAWYNSSEYQAILPLRLANARSSLILFEAAPA